MFQTLVYRDKDELVIDIFLVQLLQLSGTLVLT